MAEEALQKSNEQKAYYFSKLHINDAYISKYSSTVDESSEKDQSELSPKKSKKCKRTKKKRSTVIWKNNDSSSDTDNNFDHIKRSKSNRNICKKNYEHNSFESARSAVLATSSDDDNEKLANTRGNVICFEEISESRFDNIPRNGLEFPISKDNELICTPSCINYDNIDLTKDEKLNRKAVVSLPCLPANILSLVKNQTSKKLHQNLVPSGQLDANLRKSHWHTNNSISDSRIEQLCNFQALENNLTISPCSKRTQICKNLKLKSSRSKKLTCSERKQSSGQSMSSEDADSNNHHSSVSDDSVKTNLYSNKNGVNQGNGKVELARDAVLETSSSGNLAISICRSGSPSSTNIIIIIIIIFDKVVLFFH